MRHMRTDDSRHDNVSRLVNCNLVQGRSGFLRVPHLLQPSVALHLLFKFRG
jgi:hypothetical protein